MKVPSLHALLLSVVLQQAFVFVRGWGYVPLQVFAEEEEAEDVCCLLCRDGWWWRRHTLHLVLLVTEATAHSVYLFQGHVRASLLNVPLLLSSEQTGDPFIFLWTVQTAFTLWRDHT